MKQFKTRLVVATFLWVGMGQNQSLVHATDLTGPVVLRVNSHLGVDRSPSILLKSTGDVYLEVVGSLRALGDVTLASDSDLRLSSDVTVEGHLTLEAGGVLDVTEVHTVGSDISISGQQFVDLTGAILETTTAGGHISVVTPQTVNLSGSILETKPTSGVIQSRGSIGIQSGEIEIDRVTAPKIVIASSGTTAVHTDIEGELILDPLDSPTEIITLHDGTKLVGDPIGTVTITPAGNQLPIQGIVSSGAGVTVTANTLPVATDSDSASGGAVNLMVSPSSSPMVFESGWPHLDASEWTVTDLDPIHVTGDVLLKIDRLTDQLSVTAEGRIRVVSIVPEPASLLIFLTGLCVLGIRRKEQPESA